MLKIQDVKHFINTVFNDKIVDIKPPREDWFEYDGKLSLESYIVTVTYKYAGPKDKVFYIDYDEDIDENFYNYSEAEQRKLRAWSQRQTLKCAQDYYSRVRDQIDNQHTAKVKTRAK